MPFGPHGKYTGDQLRQVVGPNGDIVTIYDRRAYFKAYYKANRAKIRARQNPYIKERRRIEMERLKQAGGS